MELYTLASAAELVGCSPSRLKGWMEKGLIPERRIQFGRVRARVIEEASIPNIKTCPAKELIKRVSTSVRLSSAISMKRRRWRAKG